MPGQTEYIVTDETGNVLHHHHSIKSPRPMNVLDNFFNGTPELAPPNVKAVRVPYADALAQTLKEPDDDFDTKMKEYDIDTEDENIVITTTVKDGANGMGDVSVFSEVGDRFLPDKALRFAFVVLKCSTEIAVNGEEKCFTLFKEERPNSVRVTRPLMEEIADENNSAS